MKITSQELTDAQLERLINRALRAVTKAKTGATRKRAAKRYSDLIMARSSAQVRRMELERGLA